MTESSDSSDDDYQPIPQMPPRIHDAEAGSGSGNARYALVVGSGSFWTD